MYDLFSDFFNDLAHRKTGRKKMSRMRTYLFRLSQNRQDRLQRVLQSIPLAYNCYATTGAAEYNTYRQDTVKIG